MKRTVTGVLFTLFTLLVVALNLVEAVKAQPPVPNCLQLIHFTNRTGDNGGPNQTLIQLGNAGISYNNITNGCTSWSISYNSEGLSALSIVLQDAPNSYVAGILPSTFVTFAGTTVVGSNPMTDTNAAQYTATGYYPWIRANITSFTGTGSVDVVISGWKSPTFVKGGAGSGTVTVQNSAGTPIGSFTTLKFLNGTNTSTAVADAGGGVATVQQALGAAVPITIASGAKALATGAISSAACTSAQTATATGTLTTDVVAASFNGDPTAVTGYVPLTTGMLTIIPYPTTDTVNFKVCNNTSSSVTPGAITLNWRVER